MGIPSWSKECRDRAVERGTYLVKIQVQGRYADDGNISISADAPAHLAKMLIRLAKRILNHDELDCTNRECVNR